MKKRFLTVEEKNLHLVEALRDLLELAVDNMIPKREKIIRKRYEKFIRDMEEK